MLWSFVASLFFTQTIAQPLTNAKIIVQDPPYKGIEPMDFKVLYEEESVKSLLRCNKAVINDRGCEQVRLDALKSGCIKQKDYDELKEKGGYPICNFLEDGKPIKKFCTCGCFDPETLITVLDSSSNNYTVKKAGAIVSEKSKPKVIHLSQESSLQNLITKESNVTVTTAGKEHKRVYKFMTKNHRTLTVTAKHPVLTHKGVVKQAKDLTKNDQLVKFDGSFEPIVKIKRVPFRREVVNFTVAGKTPKEHLVFANGFVVGDLYFQGSLENLLNSVVVRK